MKNILCTTAIALCLSGCGMMNSADKAPAVPLPAAYMQAGTATPVMPANWWQSFNDPKLDAAIAAAYAKNNDLAAAAIRTRRAQLLADIAGENRDPAVSANISAGRNFNLKNGSDRNTSGISASVSYQADLWDKLGRTEDAARFEAIATKQDLESAAQGLAVTTATLYWQTGLYKQLLASRKSSIDYAQKTYDLVSLQRDAGAASGLELAEAQQSLAAQKAAYTQTEQQNVETATAFAILFNGPPGEAIADIDTLPDSALPEVAAGIPADILINRPDIRAAASRLKASIANTDVARANLLPNLNLTGTFGTSSSALLNLLQNPVASLGAGLTLPFLQWDLRQLDIKVSETQFEENVVNYRQAVFVALGDVENALSARKQLNAQAKELETSLAAAKKSARLYELRYKEGAVALRIWLDAQERERQSRDALLQNRYDRLVNHATLSLALGARAD